MSPDSLELMNVEIGEGKFGRVAKGCVKERGGNDTVVAVKILKRILAYINTNHMFIILPLTIFM